MIFILHCILYSSVVLSAPFGMIKSIIRQGDELVDTAQSTIKGSGLPDSHNSFNPPTAPGSNMVKVYDPFGKFIGVKHVQQTPPTQRTLRSILKSPNAVKNTNRHVSVDPNPTIQEIPNSNKGIIPKGNIVHKKNRQKYNPKIAEKIALANAPKGSSFFSWDTILCGSFSCGF